MSTMSADMAAGAANAELPPTPPAYACSHCTECGYNNFPATEVCPKCWSVSTQLLQLSPAGVLYSFSTIGSKGDMQYVGYVDLPENIRVFGLLNTTERPVCEAAVHLQKVRPTGNGPAFIFDVTTSEDA